MAQEPTVDLKTKEMVCHACGYRAPIPFGNLELVARIMSGFVETHQLCLLNVPISVGKNLEDSP